MAQIAPIHPTQAPISPPGAPPPGGANQLFSPFLEQALATRATPADGEPGLVAESPEHAADQSRGSGIWPADTPPGELNENIWPVVANLEGHGPGPAEVVTAFFSSMLAGHSDRPAALPPAARETAGALSQGKKQSNDLPIVKPADRALIQANQGPAAFLIDRATAITPNSSAGLTVGSDPHLAASPYREQLASQLPPVGDAIPGLPFPSQPTTAPAAESAPGARPVSLAGEFFSRFFTAQQQLTSPSPSQSYGGEWRFVQGHNPAADAGTLPVPAAPQGDGILSQLQEIINRSSETGRVRIDLATGQSSESATRPFTAQFTALSISGEMVGQGAVEKTSQEINGLRQSIQQQFYAAKISLENNQRGGAGNQTLDDKKGDRPANAAPTTSVAPAGDTLSGETKTTFSQVIGSTPGYPVATAEGQARVVPAAPTLTHDHQVMQQLIERFHLVKRPLDTQINIRLHPAELGALKIDLTVAEGSVRASVVAQNHQVQEIIEKNLARLRTILEDQGFTVDQLTVTVESDAVGDFNLSDGQKFDHQAGDTRQGVAGAAETVVNFDQALAAGSGEYALDVTA